MLLFWEVWTSKQNRVIRVRAARRDTVASNSAKKMVPGTGIEPVRPVKDPGF